jgi:glycolate oxidase iron-sulfur subunit
LQPDIAEALGRRKAAHVASVDPDIVAAGNLGCIVQIGRFSTIPVVHSVELVDWATGGPRPEALRDRALREPAPREKFSAVGSADASGGSADGAAIW